MRWFRLLVVAAVGLLAAAGVAPAQTTYIWNPLTGTGAGTWDTTTANWLAGGAQVPYASGPNTAVFGDRLTSASTVGLTTALQAGSLQFLNTGPLYYTLSSTGAGALTLSAGGAADATLVVGRGVVGAATYSSAGGHTLSGNATLFANNLAVTNNGAFGSSAVGITGPLTGTGGNQISYTGQGNMTVSGAVTGFTGGLTKSGAGTLNLSNGSNSFGGAGAVLAVNGGVLGAGSSDASLGNAFNSVSIAGGAAFRATGTGTYARQFTVTGTTVSPSGFDMASGVTTTLTGPLVGDSTRSLAVSLTGGTTSGILAVQNANAGYAGRWVVGTPGARLVGSVLSQKLFNSTYGPALRVDAGLGGSLAASAGITVSNDAALSVLQPATAAQTGRLGPTAGATAVPITMNSGRFVYTSSANGGAAINDTAGPLTLRGTNVFTGSATIAASAVAGPSGGTSVTFGTLTRDDNATAYFRASAAGSNGTVGGTPGATTINYFMGGVTDPGGTGAGRGVIPWAAMGSSVSGTFVNGPMTYDANGFRQLTAAEIPSGTTFSAGSNLSLNASTANVGTVQSLYMPSGITVSGTGTIAVTSGWLGYDGTITWTGPTLDFGGATGYVHTSDTMTVSGTTAQVTGTAGVVVSGYSASFNTLAFTNTSNSFSGGLFLNGNGRVSFTDNAQLGAAGGVVTFQGGVLSYANTTTDGTLTGRPLALGAANGAIGVITAGRVLTVPGQITGAGQLEIGLGSAAATGVVALTNTANSYSGGTLLTAGVLRIGDPAALGTGPLYLNGGTLQPAAAATLTFAAAPTVTATSTIDTPSGTAVVLSGGLAGSGGTGGTSLGILNKTGPGGLTLGGDSTFAGSLAVNSTTAGGTGGTVTIGGPGAGAGAAPELGAVSLQFGTTLNVNDSVGGPLQRTGRGTNLTLTNTTTTAAAGGATVNLTTAAGGGSRFTFGTLSASGGASGTANSSTINLIDGGGGNNVVSFVSLTPVAANNTLSLSGTANFGIDSGPSTGTRLFFGAAPALTAGAIANVSFTGFGGTGQATYDSQLGVIKLSTVSGTLIDNISSPFTPTAAVFTTTGATSANLGATIKSLTIAGHTVTLAPGVYAPQAGNLNAPADTLVLTGGGLTSSTAASTVTAAAPARLLFGAAASVVANTDLTIGANVTLAGTAGLTKSGTGNLTVAGPNQLGGVYTVAGTGTVTLAQAAGIAGLSGSVGTVSLGGPLTLSGNITSTFSGVLANTAGGGLALASGFTGLQTLSGTNTVAGPFPVTIGGGTLALGSAAALGAVNASSVAVAGGGSLSFTGGVTVNAQPVSLSGTGVGGAGAVSNTSGSNTFAGPLTLTGPASIGATSGTLTLTGGVTAGANALTLAPQSGTTLTLSTVALNLGTNSLTIDGGLGSSGVAVLPNLANTLGNLNVVNGTVQASADNNLGATTNTLVLDGGTFRYGAAFTTDPARTVSVTANAGTINTNGFSPTFSGPLALAAGSQLTKTGTGTLTLSPSNVTGTGRVIVSGGTLLLGNATAQGLATDYRLNSGILDLNGASAGFTNTNVLVGSGHGLVNSNTGVTSTVSVGLTANLSTGLTFGGNVVVNKSDGFDLSLSGTATVPATTTGVFNVNAGSLTLTGTANSGLGSGMSVSVANGAVFRQTLASSGATGPFGTVSVAAGGEWQVTGANYADPSVNRIALAGGRLNFTGTNAGGTFVNVTAGTAPAIVSTATGTTAGLLSSNTADLISAGAGTTALPVTVAQGTTPTGIDLTTNIKLSGTAGFVKQGPGAFALTGNASASTAPLTVSAGTLLAQTTSTGTGALVVNGTGTLKGSGTVTVGVAVTGAGLVGGGDYVGAGTPAAPAGTLTVTAAAGVTVGAGAGGGSGLAVTAGAGGASRLSLTNTAGVLNLNPGAGSPFTLSLASNPADPLVAGQPYSYTIAQVATAGNIQLNGATAPATIPAASYVPTGVALQPGYSLTVSGTDLVFSFTPVPVPEPATGLAVAAAGLAGLRAVRRRRAV